MKLKREKRYKLFFLAIFATLILIHSPVYAETFYSPKIKLEYYKEEIDSLIKLRPNKLSERHKYFSAAFLGKKYKENTLSGDLNNKEIFVINFDQMDCFTYVDYLHSLLKAENYYHFVRILKKVRYKDGVVSFKNRNHFFYNWLENVEGIEDITQKISYGNSTSVIKNLNQKNSKEFYLDGIKPKKVKIQYLKTKFITNKNLSNFRSGDYIGIYTDKEGLDVSHIGILIVKGESYIFRHASSLAGVRKVVDVNFLEYLDGKPGIIVYRVNL